MQREQHQQQIQPLLQKSCQLVLLERQYSLIRWGNKFDAQHNQDDWCAFAIKELYAHRDENGDPVYLWPGHVPDLSFMLALTGTASTILSNMDANERVAHPRRSTDSPLGLSTENLNKAVRPRENVLPASQYYQTVNQWINVLARRILSDYAIPGRSLQASTLEDILSAMVTLAKRQPTLLDEAIEVTKRRVAKAQRHPDAKAPISHNAL